MTDAEFVEPTTPEQMLLTAVTPRLEAMSDDEIAASSTATERIMEERAPTSLLPNVPRVRGASQCPGACARRPRAEDAMRVIVTDVAQSPANPRRWFLETSCGHGVWVTARRRPTRRTVVCRVCGVTP